MINKYILTAIATLLLGSLHAQINTNDSTVQVVGYWNIGDTQTFEVSKEKYKIQDKDTTAYELITYEVDVTIKDSTANSYLIEWFYKDYKIKSDNDLAQKIAKIAEDMPVLIKTDEFGAIIEVVNWEEVRDYIQKGSKLLKKELKGIPNSDKIIEQVMNVYNSKAAVEGNAIKDAIQFYTYHGGAYNYKEELTAKTQMQNNYGGSPFDSELSVILDEINFEDGNSIIRMHQTVNSKQLTDATYDYLAKLGSFGDKMPKRDEFPALTNETWTASRVHSATGWVTYSIETKEVKAEGTTNIEERIIQIK
jgi:hypothetical protein